MLCDVANVHLFVAGAVEVAILVGAVEASTAASLVLKACWLWEFSRRVNAAATRHGLLGWLGAVVSAVALLPLTGDVVARRLAASPAAAAAAAVAAEAAAPRWAVAAAAGRRLDWASRGLAPSATRSARGLGAAAAVEAALGAALRRRRGDAACAPAAGPRHPVLRLLRFLRRRAPRAAPAYCDTGGLEARLAAAVGLISLADALVRFWTRERRADGSAAPRPRAAAPGLFLRLAANPGVALAAPAMAAWVTVGARAFAVLRLFAVAARLSRLCRRPTPGE